jgi:hypothetical protein
MHLVQHHKADITMDGKEEVAYRKKKAEKKKSTVRTPDEEMMPTAGQEGKEDIGNTQGRGEGRAMNAHQQSGEELQLAEQPTSLKKTKNGEKQRERKRSRTRNILPKTV